MFVWIWDLQDTQEQQITRRPDGGVCFYSKTRTLSIIRPILRPISQQVVRIATLRA